SRFRRKSRHLRDDCREYARVRRTEARSAHQIDLQRAAELHQIPGRRAGRDRWPRHLASVSRARHLLSYRRNPISDRRDAVQTTPAGKPAILTGFTFFRSASDRTGTWISGSSSRKFSSTSSTSSRPSLSMSAARRLLALRKPLKYPP